MCHIVIGHFSHVSCFSLLFVMCPLLLAHIMPVKPGPAYVTSATPESAHDTSVKLGPAHVMPSTPEPGNVTSVTARSAHVTSCLPSQGLFTLYKMVVSQEPLHKMAATAKMATTQRQSLIMSWLLLQSLNPS